MGLALVRRVFTHVHFHAAANADAESEITLEKDLVGSAS
jgi:hypothetical protein